MLEFPQTNDYAVKIVYDSEIGRNLYGIVNKTTEVVEFQHPCFPVVYTQIDNMQEMLDSLEGGEEEEEAINQNNVTPFKLH